MSSLWGSQEELCLLFALLDHGTTRSMVDVSEAGEKHYPCFSVSKDVINKPPLHLPMTSLLHPVILQCKLHPNRAVSQTDCSK